MRFPPSLDESHGSLHGAMHSLGTVQGEGTGIGQQEQGEELNRAQLHDGIDVILIFLHFLPEADGLFQLQGVHILGPAPLNMVNPAALRLKPLRVGLNRDPHVRCHRFKHSAISRNPDPRVSGPGTLSC